MNTELRDQFPSLHKRISGNEVVYFDGPAGTQVPENVIRSISEYYKTINSNTHGQFENARLTDELIEATREQLAIFLNAPGSSTISFGANMTSLNFALSHAIARDMRKSGRNEILITQLDHEGNRGPWLDLEKYYDIKIREAKIYENGTLNMHDLEEKINEKTALVAVGMASNIFGTVNPVIEIRKIAERNGARLLLDAVHYAPHYRIDIGDLDCDFLLCSAYKFYGPHVGILYCRPGLLDALEPGRLCTQDQRSPYRIETGTLNHAAIAGVKAALDFIMNLGHGNSKAQLFDSAFVRIGSHERQIFKRLFEGIRNIPECTIYGPELIDGHKRCPTLSFLHARLSAETVCRKLAENGVFAWDGHFYAIRASQVLGLEERGGVTRMGMAVYNTEEEIDRVLSVLKDLR